MLRSNKQVWVSKQQKVFKESEFAFVFRCERMAAESMTELRCAVKDAGGRMLFAKNKLAQIAVQGTDFESMSQLFKGVSILVTPKEKADEDGYVALAKCLEPFLKANKQNMSLAGGVINGKFMDASALDTFSKTPSRLETIATIAWMLKYPLINVTDSIKRAGEAK